MPKKNFPSLFQLFHLLIIVLLIIASNCNPDPRYRNSGYQQINRTNTEPARQSAGVETRREQGIASYMADELQGRKTATGELFNKWALAAAHKTLPFGTIVRVTNLENQKTVDVRINDRGPFVKGRIIDVTYEAARRLDFIQQGLTKVEIQIIQTADKK